MAQLLSTAWHFARHRFSDLHPLEVQVQVVNACNLRCAYCRCPDIPTTMLTTAQWVDIVQGLARVGTRRLKAQGGEPTLFKGLAEILATARSLGMRTAVTTNGYGIVKSPDLLDQLDEVVVSIDALKPERHDRYRGAGSHEVAMEAADLAAARGRKVYLNMIVHRDTWDELEPLLEYCEQRGFRLNAQAVQFFTPHQNREAISIGLSQADESRLYRQLGAWRRHGRPLMFSAATYEHTSRWPDYMSRARATEGQSACMAGEFYIHVEPNGNVHPCNFHVGDFVPKNIVTDGLDSALRHARRHNCADCGVVHLEERKRLFSLKPDAILQLARRG
jgi:MoaA/NifB/PqqE/SkfB family radical SAM enzyme